MLSLFVVSLFFFVSANVNAINLIFDSNGWDQTYPLQTVNIWDEIVFPANPTKSWDIFLWWWWYCQFDKVPDWRTETEGISCIARWESDYYGGDYLFYIVFRSVDENGTVVTGGVFSGSSETRFNNDPDWTPTSLNDYSWFAAWWAKVWTTVGFWDEIDMQWARTTPIDHCIEVEETSAPEWYAHTAWVLTVCKWPWWWTVENAIAWWVVDVWYQEPSWWNVINTSGENTRGFPWGKTVLELRYIKTPIPPERTNGWWFAWWWGGWGWVVTTPTNPTPTQPTDTTNPTPTEPLAPVPTVPTQPVSGAQPLSINDPETISAYQWAYKEWITTQPTIDLAWVDRTLSRWELAKMLSVYATEVLKKEPIAWKEWCNIYADRWSMNDEVKKYTQMACELEVMWLKSDGKTPLEYFNPKLTVTRAELVTTISRMLYGNTYDNNEWIWQWVDHMEKMYSDHLITETNPAIIELRNYVMLVLYRLEK